MYRQPIRLPLLLLVAVTFSPIALGAEDAPYYTWVDENGVTNFSQNSPKDVNAVFVNQGRRVDTTDTAPNFNRRPGKVEAPEEPATESTSPETDTATAAAPAKPEISDEQLDSQMSAERAAVEAEIAKARANNCAAGKRNLARLEAYARIRIREADGSERILTDEEKAQRVTNAKQMISDNCGPS